MHKLNAKDPDFDAKFSALLKREESDSVDATVKTILDAVKSDGDKAVFRYAMELDQTDLQKTPLRVPQAEIDSAKQSLAPETLQALQLAEKRIRDYHEKFLPEGFDEQDASGVRLGSRWTALDAVGLYTPGGTAAYPSSLLMNVIPAQVAGVQRIAVVSPAKDGQIANIILAAAGLLGITEIYRIGGAHAIAALAYGCESIAPVDKITGPGNAFVASAKRQVFGTVGIDMVAGPSEVLIAADADNNPAWLAADLLSQAEHDPMAQAILITDSEKLAASVQTEITATLATLPRKDIAASSIENYGAIILVQDIHTDSPAIINRMAPEHLQLAVKNADSLMQKITHAGAIFLGAWTPEAIGDYIGGPNHVLPTSGTARFAQGLGVSDFVKRTSFMECNPESFKRIATDAKHLADLEGLQAHSLSLDLRIKNNG